MAVITDGVFASGTLDRPVPYRILLPVGYAESRKNFPTLYLLHGLVGSFENWTTLADVAKYAAGRQLIIVMPEAGDSWYTDAASDSGAYESFLISEFIPHIDGQYRTVNSKRGRGIAGQSMGGYGAMKLGLKYPNLFTFAGSMSGVLDAASRTKETPGPGWNDLGPSISRVFGPGSSETRANNDLLKIVRDRVQNKEAELPYLYFDCGVDDPYLPANQSFAQILSGATVDHIYHELPGGHDWEYWNERSRHILEIAECMLGGPRSMSNSGS